MNLFTSFIAVGALALCVFGCSAVVSEQDAAPPQAPQPSAERTLMDAIAGEFTADKWEYSNDAGKGVRSAGTTVARFQTQREVWLITDHEMEYIGHPFFGHSQYAFSIHSVFGWNWGKKKWVGSWFESQTGWFMHYEGDWDEETKSWNCTSEYYDPMSNKPARLRMVITVKDNDHHEFGMYLPGPDGKETHVWGINCTRKK